MYNFISTKKEYFSQGIFEFTNSFELKEQTELTAEIYASTRYILYLNDEYVCEGPCRGSADIRYFDTVTISKAKSGLNTVKLVVMHLTKAYSFSSVIKSNRPEIMLHLNTSEVNDDFDKNWVCVKKENHLLHYPPRELCFPYVPPFEEKYTDEVNTLCEPEIIFSTDTLDNTLDGCGKVLLYDMLPRPIPMIYPGASVPFTVVKRGNDFIEFDTGKYVTAKPEFVFEGTSDIKIIYAECYSKNGKKGKRDDMSGELSGPYDIVHTGEGICGFAPFWYRAFRFIRIEGKNIDNIFKSINARLFHYPLKIEGSFSCSDEALTKIYDISVNTLLCCMSEIFVDCPHFEQQQYLMDSTIEANVLMHLSGDVRLVKKCISEFAASQQPNGLLLANYPSGGKQIIPGFSFFFVHLLEDYLNFSHDTLFAKSHISAIDKIFTYFDREISQNGLIKKSKYWDFVDWVPDWYYGIPTLQADEPITVYNIYYAAALKAAIRICQRCGRLGLADDYNIRYEKLKDEINSKCFDAQRGIYTDGTITKTYSVHTIIWALLAELKSGGEAKALMEHLDDKDLNKTTFSMNFYLFQALKKCGKENKLYDYLIGWKKMCELHCTTWCENPDNPRSECHGWSSAPVTAFATITLGVNQAFEDEIIIAPKTGSLTWAKGSVPTRHGKIDVRWEIQENKFTIYVSAPDNTKKHIIMPSGETYISTERAFSASCALVRDM